MNRKIRNYDELTSHGDVSSRKLVLDVAEETLRRLDARERIRSIMRLDGDRLHIGTRQWDLSKKRNIYLLGGGKACNHMAMAVDETLGERLTRGIAIVKVPEDTDVFRKTEVYVGGHPLPNAAGMQATRKMLDLIDGASPDDLFIGVVSGGSSALMNCPIDCVSFEEEVAATDVLLKAGANILEINAIRRHISQVNGGMLAKRIADRGAELIGFGISDSIGQPPTGDIRVPCGNYRATPFGPDQTTLDDARKVIRDFRLESKLPRSIVDYLMNVGPEGETPKAFPQNTYFMVNTLPDSCIYAKAVADEMGIPAIILTTFLEGEAKDLGTMLGSIAREIQKFGNPVAAPCLIFACGEAFTTIPDSSIVAGNGGPSQEEVLSFALSAAKAPGTCLLSMDSEGTDGTTSVAGGITDSTSAGVAERNGISIPATLADHASYQALTAMGDTLMTGNTGTNLCDFNILYVPRLDA